MKIYQKVELPQVKGVTLQNLKIAIKYIGEHIGIANYKATENKRKDLFKILDKRKNKKNFDPEEFV